MFFENKKGETEKWSLVAMVAIVAVVGMVIMFNGGTKELTGAVPVKVYDVSQSKVIGEVDAAAGVCKYIGQDKLICPGAPNSNVQLCLGTANAACLDDAECILTTTQECVNTFGSLDISSAAAGLQSDGTCRILEVLKARAVRHIPSLGGDCAGTFTNTQCRLQVGKVRSLWSVDYMGNTKEFRQVNPPGWDESTVRLFWYTREDIESAKFEVTVCDIDGRCKDPLTRVEFCK